MLSGALSSTFTNSYFVCTSEPLGVEVAAVESLEEFLAKSGRLEWDIRICSPGLGMPGYC